MATSVNHKNNELGTYVSGSVLPVFLDIDYNYFISKHTHNCNHFSVLKNLVATQDIDYPSSMTQENTQCEWIGHDLKEIPFLQSIEDQLNLNITVISSIFQPAGHCMPIHLDTFYRSGTNPSEYRRANIFLNNFEIGHSLQAQDINGNIVSASHWKAGEGYFWDTNVLHLSSNSGITPKYTLQVTGKPR